MMVEGQQQEATMSEGRTEAQVQHDIGRSLTACGTGMFEALNRMSPACRGLAVKCLMAYTPNMPPEVALMLVLDPLSVGEVVNEEPLLLLVFSMAQAKALDGLDPNIVDSLTADVERLDEEGALHG
jgi:hypothetical protein